AKGSPDVGSSHRSAIGRPSRKRQAAVAIGPDREKVMDWDDLKPKAPKGITLGESLESLSVAELDARIASLEQEIERVRAELTAKHAREGPAEPTSKRRPPGCKYRDAGPLSPSWPRLCSPPLTPSLHATRRVNRPRGTRRLRRARPPRPDRAAAPSIMPASAG